MKKKRSANPPIRPVRPLQQNLPLLDENFSWERFEEFSRDFVARRPGVRRVSSYGKKGSKQKGIDFPAEMESGEVWSFQCRQVKEFSKAKFEHTVEKDVYKADRHIILIACQAGTPLRDAEHITPGWEIWDVTDVSRMVRQLPAESQRSLLLAHFGPFVQETFLAIKGPAAFRAWGDHFAPYLREGRLFHHLIPLVGRDATLATLEKFVVSPATIAILPGRGGIGKTKLMHKFGEDQLVEHRDRHLLYSDEGTPFSAQTLADIPAEPTTLVIDDAHRRDDLSELLALVARWPHPIKVVLVIRPEGRERIQSVLSASAFDANEVEWLPDLVELPRAQGQELADKALGRELNQLAERLYAATWDCPLVTVVGAALLRQKELPPELLEQDEDFRRAVLDKFTDAALGRLGERIDHEVAAKVLGLVSALQPIRSDDSNLRKSAAEHLAISETDVVRALDGLEEVGLLLRRGYRVRIVPDVLADHLLTRACLTSRGESTGYVDQLLDRFAAVAFDRLLANIAELDWRVRVTGGVGTQLLDRIWQIFDTGFKHGSNSTQIALLKMLKDAAVFQAGRVLDLLEYAMDHPSAIPEAHNSGLFQQGREDLLHVVAELADRCAHGGHVRRSCDLLWRLGRDDNRPMNQFPNHPIRLLAELAGYEIGKPLSTNREVLTAAEGWLTVPDAHAHVHSPLDVLDALLAKTNLDRSSDGVSVRLRAFSISPASTKPLRARVLELAEGLALGPDLKVALRGMKSLEGALHDPVGYFGRAVSDEEKKGWEDEQLSAAGALSKVVRRAEMPILQIAAGDAVAWTVHHGHSARLREAAQEVQSSVPDNFEVRMLRAMTQPWASSLFGPTPDFEAAERERIERMRNSADELASAMQTGAELVEFLESRIAKCRQAAVHVDPGYLVGLLSERHPQLAKESASIVAAAPGHLLEFVLPQFLLGVRRVDPEEALRLAKAALVGASETAAMSVAFLYAYKAWPGGPFLPADLELLIELLGSKTDEIRARATLGLESIKGLDPSEGKRLALGIVVGPSVSVGEAIAELLNPKESVIYGAMTDDDLRKVVRQLESLDNLDGYQVRQLLRGIAARLPMDLLEMITRRIDSLPTREVTHTYRPVPHNWMGEPVWAEVRRSDRARLLSHIRQEALGTGWGRKLELPELFADVVDNWSEAAPVLQEWIESGDEEKAVAAAELFSHAPTEFVFEHADVVERALAAAARTSKRTLEAVRSGFAASAESSTKSGRILEPMEQDVRVRDRSREAAARFPEGSPGRVFFEDLGNHASAMMVHARNIDEELVSGPLT